MVTRIGHIGTHRLIEHGHGGGNMTHTHQNHRPNGMTILCFCSPLVCVYQHGLNGPPTGLFKCKKKNGRQLECTKWPFTPLICVLCHRYILFDFSICMSLLHATLDDFIREHGPHFTAADDDDDGDYGDATHIYRRRRIDVAINSCLKIIECGC